MLLNMHQIFTDHLEMLLDQKMLLKGDKKTYQMDFQILMKL